MASRKSRLLTPLQQEAVRIEEERRRRKETLLAAQQYALRGQLEKKKAAAGVSMNVPSNDAESEEAPAPNDFDAIRSAIKDERHKDSRKTGQNPRYVSVLDQHENC